MMMSHAKGSDFYPKGKSRDIMEEFNRKDLIRFEGQNIFFLCKELGCSRDK